MTDDARRFIVVATVNGPVESPEEFVLTVEETDGDAAAAEVVEEVKALTEGETAVTAGGAEIPNPFAGVAFGDLDIDVEVRFLQERVTNEIDKWEQGDVICEVVETKEIVRDYDVEVQEWVTSNDLHQVDYTAMFPPGYDVEFFDEYVEPYSQYIDEEKNQLGLRANLLSLGGISDTDNLSDWYDDYRHDEFVEALNAHVTDVFVQGVK